MVLLNPRETRNKVQLSARLRDERGWSDVTICDISERGLSLRSAQAPAKGAFVEIRRGAVCVVGHVRWSHGARCGMRAQDRVPVRTMLAPPSGKPAPPPPPAGERRKEPRASGPVAPTSADRAAASRRWSRVFDWGCVALAGGLAAALVADLALTALAQPLDRARTALASEN